MPHLPLATSVFVLYQHRVLILHIESVHAFHALRRNHQHIVLVDAAVFSIESNVVPMLDNPRHR